MAGKGTASLHRKKSKSIVYQFFDLTKKESVFITIIAFLLFAAGAITPYPNVAMWFGFALAGYSAIANDSIQTIGTFIASNGEKKWYHLWLYIGLIFLATVTYSWIVYDGDVSHQRLATKGFSEAPTSFTFLQLAAPLILLILTRMRMPVSTTFLLLNAFSSEADAIFKVLKKSLTGYFVAFIVAIIVWLLVAHFVDKYMKGKPAKWWLPVQWLTSGALWAAWIMQDAANIAIFLPRSLNLWQFVGFAGYIFLGLGLLFYMRGDRIQGIVQEKSGVTDIRAATIVDFVYAILLYYFKGVSQIPMSTTWVFIGLLGGRELAIAFVKRRSSSKKAGKGMSKAVKMLGRDALYAAIGLVISIILAIAINEELRAELF